MLYLTIIGGAFIAWLILVALFTPAIPYHIERQIDSTSEHFIHVLESSCHTTLQHGNKIEILTNGPSFYPVMLDAIGGARETVNMECYICKRGEIGEQFIRALTDRAIKSYFAKINPLDKAGAYAAQGHGKEIIQRIDGSYSNVVGLPMETTARVLRAFGITPQRSLRR